MLDIEPELRIVDVTHDVPAFDVRAGALALVRAVQYLPEGVVLAVVDPGVGTDRRCVAVDVGNAVLVGPDNGLLAPAVAMLGGPQRVVEITSPDHRLVAPGPTFAGRDIMAPAAAYVAAGTAIDALGPEIDPVLLTPALVPLPNEDGDGRITGEVLWVDHYGNCNSTSRPNSCRWRARTRVTRWRSRCRMRPAYAPAGAPGGCTPSPTRSRRSSCSSSIPTACARSRST